METKATIVWGQGNFDEVNLELNSNLFSFIFQDPEERGTQASETTKMVPVGKGYGKEEDCSG